VDNLLTIFLAPNPACNRRKGTQNGEHSSPPHKHQKRDDRYFFKFFGAITVSKIKEKISQRKVEIPIGRLGPIGPDWLVRNYLNPRSVSSAKAVYEVRRLEGSLKFIDKFVLFVVMG